jgi:hypothetical protein
MILFDFFFLLRCIERKWAKLVEGGEDDARRVL